MLRAHRSSTVTHRNSCGWSRTWGRLRLLILTWRRLRCTSLRPAFTITFASRPGFRRFSCLGLRITLWLLLWAILRIRVLRARRLAWGSGSGNLRMRSECLLFGTWCRALGSFSSGIRPNFGLSQQCPRQSKCSTLLGTQALNYEITYLFSLFESTAHCFQSVRSACKY